MLEADADSAHRAYNFCRSHCLDRQGATMGRVHEIHTGQAAELKRVNTVDRRKKKYFTIRAKRMFGASQSK